MKYLFYTSFLITLSLIMFINAIFSLEWCGLGSVETRKCLEGWQPDWRCYYYGDELVGTECCEGNKICESWYHEAGHCYGYNDCRIDEKETKICIGKDCATEEKICSDGICISAQTTTTTLPNCGSTCVSLGYNDATCGTCPTAGTCVSGLCRYNPISLGNGPWSDCGSNCCCFRSDSCTPDCSGRCSSNGCSGVTSTTTITTTTTSTTTIPGSCAPSEFFKYRDCIWNWPGVCVDNPSDNACCDQDSDCVYDGICYNNDQKITKGGEEIRCLSSEWRYGAIPCNCEDSYINAWDSLVNYGTQLEIFVRNGNVKNGLVKFDLSYIPQGATVTSATLKMTLKSQGNGLRADIGTYKVNKNWVELETNWNLAQTGISWSTAGCNHIPNDREGTYSDTQSISTGLSGDEYYWDVTNMVQKWVNDPSSNYGVFLYQYNAQGANEKSFHSCELSASGGCPDLSVVWIAPTTTTTITTSTSSTSTIAPTTTTTPPGGCTDDRDCACYEDCRVGVCVDIRSETGGCNYYDGCSDGVCASDDLCYPRSDPAILEECQDPLRYCNVLVTCPFS